VNLKRLGLQKVSIDIGAKLKHPAPLIAKEGDKGTRGLLIEFEKGLKCMLYIKTEGAIYEIKGTEIEEGLYEAIYPSNLKKGNIPAEIKFYKGKEILSNYIFEIKVYKSLEGV